MVRQGASAGNPAAVQAPVAFSTYVGGLASLLAGVSALVTGLIEVVKLPSKPTAAQAAVVDGAFFLAAVAVIGFAWVVVADFRSRSLTHSAAATAGAVTSPAFKIKVKATGQSYTVLGVDREGETNLFLVNNESGDKTFHWIPEVQAELVST
jgi:hypothetical protein